MQQTQSRQKVQPDPQEQKQNMQETNEPQQDDFVPKEGVDYAEKWRQASAEAAQYRKKMSAYKQELEQQRNQELEAQGKYKEMYEQVNQKYESLKTGVKQGLKVQALKDQLVKEGINPKYLDKAVKVADLDGIELDPEGYQPDETQVKHVVSTLKEEFDVFFGKQLVAPKDGVPGSPASDKKDLKSMSDEELDKLFRQSLAGR